MAIGNTSLMLLSININKLMNGIVWEEEKSHSV